MQDLNCIIVFIITFLTALTLKNSPTAPKFTEFIETFYVEYSVMNHSCFGVV